MSATPHIIDVDQDSFQRIVLDGSFERPVLVDFWADWCQPCKAMMPTLGKLAAEYGGGFLLAKVNVDVEQALASYFQIRSVPTLMLFSQGKLVEQLAGGQSETALRKALDRYAQSESERAVGRARELAAAGRGDQALQILEALARQAPDDKLLQLEIARVVASTGDVERARAVLDTLPANILAERDAKALRAQLRFLELAPELADAPSLASRLEADPGDSEAAFQLALHRILVGDYEAAMAQLFALMRRDRGYGDDLARRTLMDLFEMLGAEDPAVKDYRRRVYNALY